MSDSTILQNILSTLQSLCSRFDTLDQRLSNMDTRFTNQDQRFTWFEQTVRQEIAGINEKLVVLEEALDTVQCP